MGAEIKDFPKAALLPVVGAIFLSGCSALSKTDGASMALYDTGSAIVSNPSVPLQSFITNAEPVFRARCIDCHTSGGRGASRFLLNSGTQLSSEDYAEDYTAAKAKLMVDDGCNFDNNLLLVVIREPSTHEFKVSDPLRDPIYLGIRQWVSDERGSVCSTRTPAPRTNEEEE